MDAIGLDNPEPLVAILRQADRDIRLVCGHIHHVQFASIGGVPVVSAPAVCSRFDIDLRADAPAGFTALPGGFLLHDWENELRSFVVPLEVGDGPFPF